jgi:hypothetical protein
MRSLVVFGPRVEDLEEIAHVLGEVLGLFLRFVLILAGAGQIVGDLES